MSIGHLLARGKFTPEQRHLIQLAYNSTLRKLNLVDGNDPVCRIVAHKIIEIAESGVTNAVAICEIATRELGIPEQ